MLVVYLTSLIKYEGLTPRFELMGSKGRLDSSSLIEYGRKIDQSQRAYELRDIRHRKIFKNSMRVVVFLFSENAPFPYSVHNHPPGTSNLFWLWWGLADRSRTFMLSWLPQRELVPCLFQMWVLLSKSLRVIKHIRARIELLNLLFAPLFFLVKLSISVRTRTFRSMSIHWKRTADVFFVPKDEKRKHENNTKR